MKAYNPHRADNRNIQDKALGLIYAMTDEEALGLLWRLREMAKPQTSGGKRAAMFCGSTQ